MPGRAKTTEGDDRPIPRNYARRWRKYRKLSLEKVAFDAGMSVPTLSEIERGKQDLTGRAALPLAKALGTTIGALFDADPAGLGAPWQLFEELAEDKRATAEALIRVVKESS